MYIISNFHFKFVSSFFPITSHSHISHVWRFYEKLQILLLLCYWYIKSFFNIWFFFQEKDVKKHIFIIMFLNFHVCKISLIFFFISCSLNSSWKGLLLSIFHIASWQFWIWCEPLLIELNCNNIFIRHAIIDTKK